jgi:hypothetical protein
MNEMKWRKLTLRQKVGRRKGHEEATQEGKLVFAQTLFYRVYKASLDYAKAPFGLFM